MRDTETKAEREREVEKMQRLKRRERTGSKPMIAGAHARTPRSQM